MSKRVYPVDIQRINKAELTTSKDLVVVEEPLEIRVGYGPPKQREQTTLTVTMRTPGDDEHLCLGFLFTEGIIEDQKDILSAEYCPASDPGAEENIMRLELAPELPFEVARFTRNFYTSASCGVCGKASIEHVQQICRKPVGDFKVSKEILHQLPERLATSQTVFKHTGGLHASALFDLQGNLLLYKEDVGRHNALDKLAGNLLLTSIDTSQTMLLLSGRVSFELVQKALRLGIAFVAAVGAPSSLAVELAKEYGITLVGFLKKDSFNIYTGFERIA